MVGSPKGFPSVSSAFIMTRVRKVCPTYSTQEFPGPVFHLRFGHWSAIVGSALPLLLLFHCVHNLICQHHHGVKNDVLCFAELS